MFAARDQENLHHGHQAAAAAKPLNQGNKQLAPKTPGNKVPKTPFKIPLNDENNAGGFGQGKTGLKLNGKGNENLVTGGKKTALGGKNALITPLGPRSRAPLGLKTTNAKAKAFQTPAPPAVDNDAGKSNQKSVSARKPKPRVSHAEMIKLEVSGDKDQLEEKEIEYMPPRAKDLPDPPDDLPELDFSMFQNGGLTRDYMTYFMNKPDEEGLSRVQREEIKRQQDDDLAEKKANATLIRDVESVSFPCVHYPECAGDECRASLESKKAADEKYKKTIASLGPKRQPILVKKKPAPPPHGPSTLRSRTAAAALSHPDQPIRNHLKPLLTNATTRKTPFILSRRKQNTPPPINPSPMRHAAAAQVSKTTMGYSAGRALRKAILPAPHTNTTKPAVNETPDPTLAPAIYIQRYGIPRLGSEMWLRCQISGCFDEDKEGDDELGGGDGVDDLAREEAERDFVFVM